MKDKMEVGEYIKLKRGDIFKIDEDTANYYNSNKEFITNEIVKHSKNIIDLIEVGDIVIVKNGLGEEELIFIDNEDKKHIVRTHKVKSIVTKEQFKEMEYRIDE